MDRQSAHTLLQQAGFTPEFVAAGMEGYVFAIGQNRIAKVWIKKDLLEIQQLRAFYAQLKEQRLPFATPVMHEVLSTSQGFTISTEERLAGVPLKGILERDPNNMILRQQGMAATVSVVEALAMVKDIAAARKLTLLGEPSLWKPTSTWGTVLGNVVALRAKRYRAILDQSVSNFEHKLTNVIASLNALNTPQIGIIHGDICPGNILIDPTTMTPIGLLDFGFLTTSADPAFDAVLSTLFFDMYSSRAYKAREELGTIFARKLGPRFNAVYSLYTAAYALSTSNAYSEDGQDGHFQWCINILNDEKYNLN